MIIYFTGTGNSRHLAKKVGEAINEIPVNSFEYIKECKKGSFDSDTPYVFVCPTYAWQIPHIFEKLIRESVFHGSDKAYFIMDCGGEIGNARKQLQALCSDKGFEFMGVYEVVMPENYTALYSAPDEKTAEKLIIKADKAALDAAEYIKAEKPFPDNKVGIADRLKSGIVNTVFYKFIVSADKFYATDKCIACGKCVRSCVLNNIELKNGKPVWGKSCTHCMACINFCPTNAIEYGKHSIGLRRYTLTD